MIKIGISACFLYPDIDRKYFGPKTLCYLENDMATYLSRPDVLPIMIPDLQADQMKHFLSQMDGFVFQGGSDLAPVSYGEKPIVEGKWPGDAYRDEYELTLMHYAMKMNKPIYGICRGFQLMNVYFGGKLYQDIETQIPSAIQHRDAKLYDQLNHHINFVKGNWFYDLYRGTESEKVNSVHHQGIKTIGKNLEVTAKCREDDMVEAFSYTESENGKVFGVQWHPEFFHNSKGSLIDADVIYDKFLEHCKGKL